MLFPEPSCDGIPRTVSVDAGRNPVGTIGVPELPYDHHWVLITRRTRQDVPNEVYSVAQVWHAHSATSSISAPILPWEVRGSKGSGPNCMMRSRYISASSRCPVQTTTRPTRSTA